MATLTTHVLDQTQGIPGSDIDIALYRMGQKEEKTLLQHATTNTDGRVDSPLLDDDTTPTSQYELVFQVGDYFRRTSSLPLSEPAFLEQVVLRFSIDPEGGHYHIPLLLTPYGYSTYRGS